LQRKITAEIYRNQSDYSGEASVDGVYLLYCADDGRLAYIIIIGGTLAANLGIAAAYKQRDPNKVINVI
jgi:hypothetical protein